MKNNPLPRLDNHPEIRERLLPFCRLQPGDIWDDPDGKHRIGCSDAADHDQMRALVADAKATLAIHDPPYNLVAFERRSIHEFIEWCRKWIRNTTDVTAPDASLYVWLGADQNDGFQPLPDFMLMMRDEPYRSRSFITMRNQRGYGTQRNWMAVRQELLYYTKGSPVFNVDAEYTDIPKILRGYYKEVNGHKTDEERVPRNFDRELPDGASEPGLACRRVAADNPSAVGAGASEVRAIHLGTAPRKREPHRRSPGGCRQQRKPAP